MTPKRIARIAGIPELEVVLEAFRTLYAEAIALRDTLDREAVPAPAAEAAPEAASEGQGLDRPVEIAVDVSHEAATGVPRHSDTTSDPSSVTTTTQRPGAPANADVAVEREQGAAGDGVKPENPRQRPRNAPPRDPIAADWSAAQLYDAASDEFRACLDRERRAAGPLRPADFVEAAWTMRHMLGISQHAWAEACQVLGPFAAALAVLVLDRNRDHPTHPVRSPGGALRAMTAKARKGNLDLDASLFALMRRSRTRTLDRLN